MGTRHGYASVQSPAVCCAKEQTSRDMGTTRTIEGVPLDTRSGLWADCCSSFSLTEVQVAIVDKDSLELLRTVTGSTCMACGASD